MVLGFGALIRDLSYIVADWEAPPASNALSARV